MSCSLNTWLTWGCCPLRCFQSKVTFILISYLEYYYNQLDTFHVFRAFVIDIGGENVRMSMECTFAVWQPWQVLIGSGQSVSSSAFSFSSQHAACMYPKPGMFVTTNNTQCYRIFSVTSCKDCK